MDINFLKGFYEAPVDQPQAVLTASGPTSENFLFFRYIRGIIFAIIFLMPLFFLPWTSEIRELNKLFLFFILTGAGAILYLAQVVKSGHLVFKKSWANYAVLIFLAAVILASVFSDLKYTSIFGSLTGGAHQSLITAATSAVFFFLVFNTFGVPYESIREDLQKILKVLGLSLFVTLVLGVLEIFGLSVFKLFGVSQALFNSVGTTNALGIVAAILLILSLSEIALKGERDWFRFIRMPALLLSLFFLLVLNWWVLWLVAISGLVFILTQSSISDWRISNYFWPLLIILLAVVFILLDINLASAFNLNLPIEVAPSFKASFNIAKGVLSRSPLFGVGPENFPLAYDLYKPQSINNTAFWNLRFSQATSELFNTAIGLGLVGLAGFLFLIWVGFRQGLRNGFLPLFAALVAAWVLYPFNLTLSFIFWLVFGLVALASFKQEDEVVINLEKSPHHSLITSVSFVAILILIVVGLYFTGLRYAANIKFARALAVTDIDRQTQVLVDAVNLDRREDIYSRSLANLLIARTNQELQGLRNAGSEAERQGIVARIQNFSATAINISSETTTRHPQNSTNWINRALVYENLINVIDGSDQWAIRMYQEATKVSPKDPLPYLRIGNIYFTRAEALRQAFSGAGSQNLTPQARTNIQNQIVSDFKLAEQNYQKAIELKPNYVLAIYNLGVVYEREGRVKESVRQLELTRQAFPLDANLALQLGLLYYRDNQKDKSFSEFERALNIFSDFSNARWYLALLYEEKGELDRALGELRKIEVLNPDNQILKQKIADLEKGRRSIPPEKVTGFRPLEEGGSGSGSSPAQ